MTQQGCGGCACTECQCGAERIDALEARCASLIAALEGLLDWAEDEWSWSSAGTGTTGNPAPDEPAAIVAAREAINKAKSEGA